MQSRRESKKVRGISLGLFPLVYAAFYADFTSPRMFLV